MPQYFLTSTSVAIKIKMWNIMTGIHKTHDADCAKMLGDSLN